jgi:hypothetical protein
MKRSSTPPNMSTTPIINMNANNQPYILHTY